MSTTIQFLRRQQVQDRTGLARSTIYEMIEKGSFPAPVKLGGVRSVAWIEAEVSDWMHQQVAVSRSGKKMAG